MLHWYLVKSWTLLTCLRSSALEMKSLWQYLQVSAFPVCNFSWPLFPWGELNIFGQKEQWKCFAGCLTVFFACQCLWESTEESDSQSSDPLQCQAARMQSPLSLVNSSISRDIHVKRFSSHKSCSMQRPVEYVTGGGGGDVMLTSPQISHVYASCTILCTLVKVDVNVWLAWVLKALVCIQVIQLREGLRTVFAREASFLMHSSYVSPQFGLAVIQFVATRTLESSSIV